MGIASLVLGIIGLVFSIIPGFWWLGITLGVVGIVLGAIGKKKGAKNASAGLVLSIIAVALGFVLYIACVACAAAGSLL